MPSNFIRNALGKRDEVLDGLLRWSLLDRRLPTIQVDDTSGRLLQLLTLLHKPSRVIEIGTLFGYSTIYLARGLTAGGKVVTLEIDEHFAAHARVNIERAGLSDKAEVVVCDARSYLSSVDLGSVDIIFIDAKKDSYREYFDLCMPLLRSGGLLIADDANANGDYSADGSDEENSDKGRNGILEYLAAVMKCKGLFSAFVPTEHGLIVSYKE